MNTDENKKFQEFLLKEKRKSFIYSIIFLVATGAIIIFSFQSIAYKNQLKESKKLIENQKDSIQFLVSVNKNYLAYQENMTDSLLNVISLYNKSIEHLKSELEGATWVPTSSKNTIDTDLQKIDEVQNSIVSAKTIAYILWVDDHPKKNTWVIQNIKSRLINFEQVTSTEAALARMKKKTYQMVISAMSQGRNNRAGLKLIRAIRTRDKKIPIVIYSESAAKNSSLVKEAIGIGANLITGNYKVLVQRINSTVSPSLTSLEAINTYKIGIYFYEENKEIAQQVLNFIRKAGFTGKHELYIKDDDFFNRTTPPKSMEIRYEPKSEELEAFQLKSIADKWRENVMFELRPVRSGTPNFISIFIPRKPNT